MKLASADTEPLVTLTVPEMVGLFAATNKEASATVNAPEVALIATAPAGVWDTISKLTEPLLLTISN